MIPYFTNELNNLSPAPRVDCGDLTARAFSLIEEEYRRAQVANLLLGWYVHHRILGEDDRANAWRDAARIIGDLELLA